MPSESERLAMTGRNLLLQLVGGKNALRQLNVFWCNDGEHAADCKCFWEQCEAWAKADAEFDAPPPSEAPQPQACAETAAWEIYQDFVSVTPDTGWTGQQVRERIAAIITRCVFPTSAVAQVDADFTPADLQAIAKRANNLIRKDVDGGIRSKAASLAFAADDLSIVLERAASEGK